MPVRLSRLITPRAIGRPWTIVGSPKSPRLPRRRASIRGAWSPKEATFPPSPVPGLPSAVAMLAGYAATLSGDRLNQIRIMVDAICADGELRVTPAAMVRLCASGRATLDDIASFGLHPRHLSRQAPSRFYLLLSDARPPSARGMRHMGDRETPATAKIRAELPLRGCPLHPGFCGFPHASLRCGRLSCGRPGGAHPAERLPARIR